MWIFDSLLKSLATWKIPVKENLKPSTILSDEKLKLLDLYSDYFANSGSDYEKANKAKLLAKMLLDL